MQCAGARLKPGPIIVRIETSLARTRGHSHHAHRWDNKIFTMWVHWGVGRGRERGGAGRGRGGYTIGVGCSSVLSSRGMVQILGSNFPQMALDINLSVI